MTNHHICRIIRIEQIMSTKSILSISVTIHHADFKELELGESATGYFIYRTCQQHTHNAIVNQNSQISSVKIFYAIMLPNVCGNFIIMSSGIPFNMPYDSLELSHHPVSLTTFCTGSCIVFNPGQQHSQMSYHYDMVLCSNHLLY